MDALDTIKGLTNDCSRALRRLNKRIYDLDVNHPEVDVIKIAGDDIRKLRESLMELIEKVNEGEI
jgi:hypothetical protein